MSPKARRIRTGRVGTAIVESESKENSDRVRRNRRRRVRKQGEFGQGEEKQSSSSPKVRRIRTGRVGTVVVESESKENSDSSNLLQFSVAIFYRRQSNGRVYLYCPILTNTFEIIFEANTTRSVRFFKNKTIITIMDFFSTNIKELILWGFMRNLK